MKDYHLSEHSVGEIPTLVEPTRQLETEALLRKTGRQKAADKEYLPQVIQLKL